MKLSICHCESCDLQMCESCVERLSLPWMDVMFFTQFSSVKNKFGHAFSGEYPYRIQHVLECEFYLLEMMVNISHYLKYFCLLFIHLMMVFGGWSFFFLWLWAECLHNYSRKNIKALEIGWSWGLKWSQHCCQNNHVIGKCRKDKEVNERQSLCSARWKTCSTAGASNTDQLLTMRSEGNLLVLCKMAQGEMGSGFFVDHHGCAQMSD